MSAGPLAPAVRWYDALVRPTQSGFCVEAAGPKHAPEVLRLADDLLRSSVFEGRAALPGQRRAWVDRILASHLWLVLLLRDREGTSCGLAVCQYTAYDVDREQRILKCKHLYVRPQHQVGLLPLASVLLDAIYEAARRSPQVRDVFLVSFGATEHARVARLLARRGFRRIGTQHLGWGRGGGRLSQVREICGPSVGDTALRARLLELATDFLHESARGTFRGVTQAPERLVDEALLAAEHGRGCVLLAFEGERVVGFIAGRPIELPLVQGRYLQNSYFYVQPGTRGSQLSVHLFDAFADWARRHGLDGLYLGTSGEISLDRVCRLLDLRGYSHSGDVFARAVAPYPAVIG